MRDRKEEHSETPDGLSACRSVFEDGRSRRVLVRSWSVGGTGAGAARRYRTHTPFENGGRISCMPQLPIVAMNTVEYASSYVADTGCRCSCERALSSALR